MTPLVLGAMYFGTRTNERTSVEILDRFVDAGGTMIDTSDNYSFWSDPSGFGGQSEAVLGRWLAARPGMRDRVYLSTKVGAQPLVPGGYPDDIEGLSAATIKDAVQRSLRQLGTDRIDLYWARVEDRSVPVEETVAAFRESRHGRRRRPRRMLELAHLACRAGPAGRPRLARVHAPAIDALVPAAAPERPGCLPIAALRLGHR
jgi:aryl-alcohol dehydrogenase-like predicted oxidoreductase